MSFPSEYHEYAHWSSFLLDMYHKVAPEWAELSRFWPTIGSLLLCFTVVMSPHLRRILSHKFFLWLGKISFPLYLLHGSFMRSILSWLLFANSKLTEMEESNKGETYVVMRYLLPSIPTFMVVMPIFFAILFAATHFWAIKVEPYFGIITKRMEDLMTGKQERPPALPVRHD